MITGDSYIGSHSQHRLSDQVSANTNHDRLRHDPTIAARPASCRPITTIVCVGRQTDLLLDSGATPPGVPVIGLPIDLAHSTTYWLTRTRARSGRNARVCPRSWGCSQRSATILVMLCECIHHLAPPQCSNLHQLSAPIMSPLEAPSPE